jgi:para-nitrobenzyl esterase
MALRTKLRLGLAAATVLVAAPVLAHDAMEGSVMTEQGLVKGTEGKQPGVKVFKGIPFAAPPVGELRFEQPRAPLSWDGVRDATEYGAPCIQPKAPQRVPRNSATDFPDSPEISEDCLFLNIWTPAEHSGEKLPVMVWLYGGAYNEGGGNAPFSEGDNLATKGAVVVTFNYRVGSLGFFSHPELTAASEHGASGNQALGDSIAALTWVKRNIAAFGGDPSRVTIFGESAGAAMDGGLAGAPPAAGTFDRAISQSGAWMGLGIAKMVTREDAEARSLQAMEQAGVKSLAELKAMPAMDVFTKIRGQGMIIDGYIIPEDLTIAFEEGRQNKVDVLVGSNGDEGSFTGGFGPPMTAESWKNSAAQRWGDLAEVGLAAYPAETDEEAKIAATKPFSDAMSWHMRLFAEKQAEIGQQAWHYWFTHKPLYDEGVNDMGAAHTGEIPFVFDNLARTFPGNSSVELNAGNPEQEAMADLVSQYWVNFAATGNPNGEGLPHWPSMDELGSNEVMILDSRGSGKGDWLTLEQVELYSQQYENNVRGPLMGEGE